MLFLHTSNRGVYIFFAESSSDAIKHIKEDLHTEEIKLTKIQTAILYQLVLPIGFKIRFLLKPNVGMED